MKIYSGDIDSLRRQTETYLDYIYKKKNKVETLDLIANIEVLLSTEECMMGRKSNYWKKLKTSRNLVVEQIIKTNRLNKRFIDEFIRYKNFHHDFISSLLEKIDYEVFDDAVLEDEEEKITLKEDRMYDLIAEFLTKNNDEKLLNKLNNLVKKHQVYKFNFKDSKYVGMNLQSSIDRENYIFINGRYDSFEQIVNLVHELGHIKDQEELLNYQSDKNAIYYNFKSSMSEVVSSYYEIRFLSYLLDLGLYPKRTTATLVDYNYFMLDQLELVKNLSSLDDCVLQNENYKKIDQETFSNILIDKDNEDVNSGIEDYDIFDNVSYGYGRLMALYFSYLEKSNKEKFTAVYKKFNINKSDYLKPTFFSELGIKEDDIITGVGEKMKKQSLKILKRKY